MFTWLQSLLGSKPSTPPLRPTPAASTTKGAKPRDTVRELILSGRAPDDLVAETVDLANERTPFRLPSRLRCVDLLLGGSAIAELPPGIVVANRLDLSGCANLRQLPAGLRTGTLNLSACTALTALPENLAVHFLVLDACTALHTWPDSAQVTLGRVSAIGCTALTQLPRTLGPLSSLNLAGCTALGPVPAEIRVVSHVTADAALAGRLPEALRELVA